MDSIYRKHAVVTHNCVIVSVRNITYKPFWMYRDLDNITSKAKNPKKSVEIIYTVYPEISEGGKRGEMLHLEVYSEIFEEIKLEIILLEGAYFL